MLTRSARPPDGVTASYILRVLAKTSREQIIQGSTASPEDQVFLRLFAAILPELRNQVQVALNQGELLRLYLHDLHINESMKSTIIIMY